MRTNLIFKETFNNLARRILHMENDSVHTGTTEKKNTEPDSTLFTPKVCL